MKNDPNVGVHWLKYNPSNWRIWVKLNIVMVPFGKWLALINLPASIVGVALPLFSEKSKIYTEIF